MFNIYDMILDDTETEHTIIKTKSYTSMSKHVESFTEPVFTMLINRTVSS